MTLTVDDIMKSRAGEAVSIQDTDTVRKAIGLLTVKHRRAANVVDASGEACGLISEYDLACAIADQGDSVFDLTVGDVMSFDILIAAPEMLVTDAIKMMVDQRVQHMTVMDESGHFFGSIGLMESMVAHTKSIAE